MRVLKPTDVFRSSDLPSVGRYVPTFVLREILQDHLVECPSVCEGGFCDACQLIKGRFALLFKDEVKR